MDVTQYRTEPVKLHISREPGCEDILLPGYETIHSAGMDLRAAVTEPMTLMPGDWHAFWGDSGDVLIGEVSTVNDDETDNIFREPIGRFANIDEDVAPKHLLVSDYRTWLA